MDPLAQFDAIIPEFQKLALGAGLEQLDAPTPCEKWAVRDLFGHIIGGATTFAAVVRGQEPPAIPEPRDGALAATANAALVDVDSAFRTPGAMEETVATPFGEMPGETFARLLAFDLLMHTTDLASATGQSFSVPDDVVTAVDGFTRVALTPALRGPETFGPEVEPAADATTLERLVAFSGRRR
jgi:uncharacterized protein (TIGR03086 family)